MRLLKQLSIVFGAVLVLFGLLMVFTYDIVKIDWPVFMEIQPSFRQMEDPLRPPERSIPVEGAAFIPNMGTPENPVPADDASIARGAQLYSLHCLMCHGKTGEGNGSIAAFLVNYKPANLTLEVVQSKSDGALFLTISNGVIDRMPALNENLDVRERWDVVNYIRTFRAMQP